MAAPVLMELNDRRLVYRPWKVGSALVFVVAGIALLVGSVIWAQMNDRTLQSATVALLVGGVLTVYGLFYIWKNAEILIFDISTGRISRKLPLLPGRDISRFNDIYSISRVGEMRTFHYVLQCKSQHGGGDIPISDDFLSAKREPERVAFEENILPVISAMLNLQPE
jgi:hypothetical protein